MSGSFSGGPSPEDVNPNAKRDTRTCPCGRSDAWLSHFATFPPDLAALCIRVGTSERGACAVCGAPWRRVVEHKNAVIIRNPSGWRPSCACGSGVTECVVLDPFAGAGTTVLTALSMGRSAVGLELNPDYADMARERVRQDAPLFNTASEERV